ncbi:MAG: putative histidine kinase, atypical hybrid [Myxococcales bacterium]|nr:putative histidine kinase, atypical hybrid [Myxococcales bacterium]
MHYVFLRIAATGPTVDGTSVLGRSSTTPLNVLLVEDNPADADFVALIVDELRAPEVLLVHVPRVADAIRLLTSRDYDAVLVDLSRPDTTGLGDLRSLRRAAPALPIVVLTSSLDEKLGLAALADGAQDYLLKGDVNATLLMRTLRFAMERQQFVARVQTLTSERTDAEAATSRAELANRAKDDFLAMVSHELRTPLSAMLGWSQMLLTETLSDERRVHAIQVIERNAQTQARLIEDILDVSRIVTGSLQIKVHRIDPVHVVERAIDAAAPAAEKMGITVTRSVEGNLPLVHGDDDRLLQVCSNLLNNAIKFTKRGGQVRVSLRSTGGFIELAIADNGAGIHADFLPHVFERYQQANRTSTRAHGGLGLGLSIVRHLVELHAGTIEARSEGLGHGAVFTVRIPVAPPTAPPPGGETTGILRIGAMPDLAGRTLLLVEEDRDSRELLMVCLERSRIRILVASTAEEALVLVQSERPDLLISDLRLSGKDGIAMIKEIRSLAPEHGGQTPAMALTAVGEPTVRARALEAGFDSYATKPFEPERLISTVARLSRGRKRSDAQPPLS